jgi:hypothetical protein
MNSDISAILKGLKNAPIQELKKKYRELFESQEEPSTNNVWLYKKIAYKMQELEYGGLSEKAKLKLRELIERYDPINNKAVRPEPQIASKTRPPRNYRDKRIPIPGSSIIRTYKDQKLEVKVLENGFEYDGKIFKSLTMVTKVITGSNWNAFNFFKL